jgi:1-acyl-sn-glycerol-3-phosphate acyltransferase
MTLVRSVVFNIAYYFVTILMVLGTLPVFVFGSEQAGARMIRAWGSVGIFLLRTIAGTRLEVRGMQNIPPGGVIVAAKHQSMFETFALFPVLARPTYVMKQELARIPLWGWYAKRAGMIAVERDQGTSALRKLATSVAAAIAKHRQIIIFPEGTRQTPGADPDYKGGIAHLYRMSGAPVVPAALNTGLFWPRRRFMRYPGTIVIEFLSPIMPGLKSKEFLERLESEIEAASDALLLETASASPQLPFLPETARRLQELRRV